MNTTELVQWQIIDDSCGCVFPWFTHPFLEVLKTWDLKWKRILEFGGGRSTAWWASKSAWVFTVESNPKFYESIKEELIDRNLRNKVNIQLVEINDDPQQPFDLIKRYAECPWSAMSEYGLVACVPPIFDIIVIDGILRYECIAPSIKNLSKNGGKLIIDNWQQDGFICPACADLLSVYEGHIYRQEDHTDHHGNPWQTAYFEIPAK